MSEEFAVESDIAKQFIKELRELLGKYGAETFSEMAPYPEDYDRQGFIVDGEEIEMCHVDYADVWTKPANSELTKNRR